MSSSFEMLVQTAETQAFTGWNFSWLKDRWREFKPTWDYRAIVRSRMDEATALLDMGTGGGEFLSSLQPLPPHTCATEGYAPNVAIAQTRLAPLGVEVSAFESDDALPFNDGAFDLIINRHESFAEQELYRLLRPQGWFVTQQVGGQDNIELNQWLQDQVETEYEEWSLAVAVQQLREAGFKVIEQREEFPETHFYDIGAVVYYLKIIEWQISGFTVERYETGLREIHRTIQETGQFVTHSHRFLIEAYKDS